MNGLIDMHCHILPGVDDGAKTQEQTLNMIKMAYEDGVRHIIATPHHHIGRMIADLDVCKSRMAIIKNKIDEMNIDMQLHLGSEVYYYSESMNKIDRGEIFTLAGSSYVLFEFDQDTSYERIVSAVRDASIQGYVPILAHIERYYCLVGETDKCLELIRIGALLQVNASSVMGKYGFRIKMFIKKLMKKKYISFVASDAHGDDCRRPYLMECYTYVKKKYSEEYANQIFCYNQSCIINDEKIYVFDK